MNYTNGLSSTQAKPAPLDEVSTGHVTVTAMSANHAITLAMVEIPNSLSKVQITTVQQLE